ncbi:MAG: hypothetical protein ACREMO_08535 [Gemmatimonadales bacterium]
MALLCSAVLTGCLAVPIPHIGHQVGPEELGQLSPGESTKEQVAASLGSPILTYGGSFALYQWSTSKGTVLYAGYGGADAVRFGNRDFRVLTVFDGANRLSRYEVVSRPAGVAGQLRDAAPKDSLADIPVRSVRRLPWSGSRPLTSLAFGGDGLSIFGSDGGKSVWRWRVEPLRGGKGAEAERITESLGSDNRVRALVRLPDGRVWAAGGTKEAVAFGEPEGKGSARTIDLASRSPALGRVMAAAISADGKIAAGGRAGIVRLWDGQTGQERQTLVAGASELITLAFSPDGRLLAAGDADGAVRLFVTATGRQLAGIAPAFDHQTPRGLAFSPDGSILATSPGPTSELWRLASLDDSAPGPRNLVTPDAVLLLPFGQVIKRYRRGEPVTCPPNLAFSPDGDRLAVLSEYQITLWQAGSGRRLESLAQPGATLCALAFSPDGTTLAAGGHNGVFLWAVPPPDSESGSSPGQ